MWMEEHIGKRVNVERSEEAVDTGASAIATGCPFCRVMMTDGVDDVTATRSLEKAPEVLDVAQLLLGSLDKSAVTLPEKGTAAKEAEERAARVQTEVAELAEVAEIAEEIEADTPAGSEPVASTATESKPVTGLGISGGAKRPGAKKAAPAAESAASAAAEPEAAAPVKGLGIAGGAKRPGATKAAPAAESAAAAEAAAPVKGLGIAGGAKRPGAKKTAPAAESAPAAEPETAPAEAPAAPVKGLGIASGARRPGAKKAPASPNEGAATVVQPANVDPDKAEAGTEAPGTADSDRGLDAKPEPEVKGLGIAAGARRPGAKKAPAATPAPAAKPAPEPEAAPEPEPAAPSDSNGETRVVGEEPPVKGLGIAKGARRPGRR